VSTSVPNASAISSSFRKLLKRLDGTRKKINSAAASESKTGDYDAAKEWMEVGRVVSDFRDRAEAFNKEWKALVKGIRASGKRKKSTADFAACKQTNHKRPFVWRFYKPLLGFLAGRGGTASSEELISDLEQNLGDQLTERDRVVSSKTGLPKWHTGIRKVYKQCQREGWIERRRDGVWKITAKGRVIADTKV
jgi:hypothetical protein